MDTIDWLAIIALFSIVAFIYHCYLLVSDYIYKKKYLKKYPRQKKEQTMSYVEYTVRVWSSGTKQWFLNNQYHREDGPAVEWASGSKDWWINGQRHREDGPAVERTDGYKAWYLNGKEVKEKDVMGPKDDCEGKVVEIEGKKYRLASI